MALQLKLGALSNTQFQMDTTRALEGNLGTTRGSLEQGFSEVQKAPDTRRNCFEASVVSLLHPEVHLSSGGAKIDVIGSNFSNNLAILQVQKFEARHHKITQENKFNKISSFSHKVAPLSYAQSRTLLLYR